MNSIRRTENPETVLDRAALAGLRAFDPNGDLTRKWIGLFLAEAPRRVEEIEAALDARNLELAAQLAHSLKSNSGWLGGHALTRLCQHLEHTAREGSAEECRRHLPAVRHHLPLLARELVSYLGAAA